MNRFLELFSSAKPVLIMSLPHNDPALCRAAFEEGADVVKVHINVEHRASGTHFGSLAQESAALQEMLDCAKGPMGLVPGASLEAAERDIAQASQLGFDFFSIYAHHMPAAAVHTPQAWMTACDGSYAPQEIAAMEKLGAAVVEASVMPGAEYGQRLSMRDLLRYSSIVQSTSLPVVVPTQRLILPQEVKPLAQTGVRGLMIGAVVTGRTEESIRRSVGAFRNEIDRM